MNDYNYMKTDRNGEVCDSNKKSPKPLSFPVEYYPREKLMQKGPASLSDKELLAILLNMGIKGKKTNALVMKLLERLDKEKEIPSVEKLAELAGLGKNRACSVLAMLEFGRRRWGAAGMRVHHPQDIFTVIRHYADRRQERFICISLNGAYEVLAVRIVTIGLVNKTIVHPREVFADPLADRATAVICAHNHPSGQLTPSPEDDEITERLQCSAEILGINFLDHIIFSDRAYFSYRQTGKLKEEP
ncbi:MAG: DNA repair protein RadC [Treponema sp.]|jgi:DNA repair protein RadC|nr:DNA repair protein RadC [Treponema sp.]